MHELNCITDLGAETIQETDMPSIFSSSLRTVLRLDLQSTYSITNFSSHTPKASGK